MNSHILKSLLAPWLVAGATAAASAQELKIGYVNSDRVLRDAAPAKAAQAKLEAEFSKREKDLNELANR
jgi:outer membrane protein